MSDIQSKEFHKIYYDTYSGYIYNTYDVRTKMWDPADLTDDDLLELFTEEQVSAIREHYSDNHLTN